MKSPYKLTSKIQQEICQFIQAGGFPHVAASAAGIPASEFEKWMQLGDVTKKLHHRKPYIAFRLAVLQAQAQARLAAEIQAHQDSPLVWLKQGPGKETPTSTGWTVPVKPTAITHQQINLLLSPEMQGIFLALLQILAPFPEARAAVAKALYSQDQPKALEAQ
jgi:hypothetical protein